MVKVINKLLSRTGFAFLFMLIGCTAFAQGDYFPYRLEIKAVDVTGFPGLHSFAYGQLSGKWVLIGGRRDGLHARQPNSSFPSASNNTEIFLISIEDRKLLKVGLDQLETPIREQLQSTNMQFVQEGEYLYVIGGYAFSPTKGDHVTFPYLTVIHLPGLIGAIESGSSIQPYFRQLEDERFAVTGGQLAKLDGVFFLVGGHRFDGRYNPVGNPTFTQSYTNQIRKFRLASPSEELAILSYEAITDPVHLRRRDYNLIPQIFPDGSQGYTISSGVFQLGVDLPYLYPVDISASGYQPITAFNQYLSNYHSAKGSLYDSENKQMHTLFFGGISQYYYKDGVLVKDDLVPFVKTISRLTRSKEGVFHEYLIPLEMPGLVGAGSEFIPNEKLPHIHAEVVDLNKVKEEDFLLGYVVGGIQSPSLNPFASNQTSTTSADKKIYEVKLKFDTITSIYPVDGGNPYDVLVYPNPGNGDIFIRYQIDALTDTRFFITNSLGQIVSEGSFENQVLGNNERSVSISPDLSGQVLLLTVIFGDKYYVTKRVIR